VELFPTPQALCGLNHISYVQFAGNPAIGALILENSMLLLYSSDDATDTPLNCIPCVPNLAASVLNIAPSVPTLDNEHVFGEEELSVRLLSKCSNKDTAL
jgi:hypothetical protein